MLLLAAVMFISTGCYCDRCMAIARCGAATTLPTRHPRPYYRYDPDGYGYRGYGTGGDIGVSSHHGGPRYRRGYYGRRDYGRSGLTPELGWPARGGRRGWDGRGDRRRNSDRRSDDDGDQRSSRRRRARSARDSEVGRSTAPDSWRGESAERQPEFRCYWRLHRAAANRGRSVLLRSFGSGCGSRGARALW